MFLCLLAAPAGAEAASDVKRQSVRATEQFWAHDQPDAELPWLRFELLDPARVQRCRQVSNDRTHCVTTIVLRDNYGCGYGRARVSVGRRARVIRSSWRPFYGVETAEYDPASCTAYGFQAWRGTTR